MANLVTNIYKNLATGGGVSLSGDTFYCALLNSTITSEDTSAIQRFETYADIASYELSGVGYTTSGEQLTNVSLSASDAGNNTLWVADDVTWTNATFDASGAVIYKSGGYPVVGVISFDGTQSVSNSSFNLKFTNGAMTIN